MLQNTFIEQVLVPFKILDKDSALILDKECKALNVTAEVFLLACRGICRDALIKINLFLKNYIHLTKEDIISFFNIDTIKNEIQKIELKSEKIKIPSLPKEGEIVDKYKIESVLGKGATSVVYKAINTYLGSEVALKVLSPQLIISDPSTKERFLQEAYNTSKIQHENIVKVIDAEGRGDYSYIVMEYIKGKTLDEILKEKGRLSSKDVVRIAKDLCRVLNDAHKIGLIHQDIKPGNIMFTNKNQIKLADFGLSRIVSEPSKYQTISGKIYGSPYYMSPEAFTSPESVDLRSDMYSLGVTLYHLVTGRLPFETQSVIKIITMHVSEMPIPPSYLYEDIDRNLSHIIMQLLEKVPTYRYSSYAELYNNLLNINIMNQSEEKAFNYDRNIILSAK